MDNIDVFDIVLVEDNPNDAELTIRALKKNNLANNLLWLEDGAEALDYFSGKGKYSGRNLSHPPKVVLLDLKLPKVSGLELLKYLKSNEHTIRIPIVVVTSSQESTDIREAYKLGVNSYVVKPVDFSQFVTAMSQLGLYWILVNKTL